MPFGPLVDADWVRDHLRDSDVRVIDFRWYLAHRNGRDEYTRGHIPGAVFVDLEAVTGREGGGRHPLPTAEQFEVEMRNAGVGAETRVVVYDDATAAPTASRLWFLLRLFGHRAQAVLDGGLQAWGQPLETATPQVRGGDFRATQPDMSRVLDCEAVSAIRDVPVIDARLGERYRGEKEPIDPKAGHVPGAINLPYTENVTADGRFKSPDELRRQYERLGAGRGAVFYCGSGVNATQQLLAMEIAGLPNARLYAGSWSDWSNRDLPVATGEQP
ncbi:MAG TPA: sulfurtransferase [Candidatus Dormibacteraeota bacterium]|nr:sulfurtransferase [Candidatus Dormibacteraeota bacterium]